MYLVRMSGPEQSIMRLIGTDEKRPAVRPASVLLVRLFGCVTVKPDFSLASVRVTTMRLCLLKCQTALDGAG